MAFAFVAVFAPLLTSHSSTDVSLPDRLKPPAWDEGGSPEFLLGTDKMGRDLLTRIFYGARIAFMVAGAVLLVGASVGAAVGIFAGYMGGRTDAFLMRAVDAGLSFPTILFALILAVTLGPGFDSVILAIGLVLWARFARIIRGEVLSVKEKDFVALARISGASHLRIMIVHILPNVLNTLVVLTTLNVGWVIIVEASLSFLGAGIPPPTPSWGQMVASGREYISTDPWLSLAPGLAIALMVLGFNLLGDWLRDTLDPKLRQV
jgi:peptide/nickel transport system permease protein